MTRKSVVIVCGRTLGTALLCTSTVGAAPTSREPIRLRYAAPAGCPGEARFVEELSARTERARLADGGEPAWEIAVFVDAASRGSHGVVETKDPHGATSRREVSGDSCAEVVSALALIAALTVDSEARTDDSASVSRAPEGTRKPLDAQNAIDPTSSGSSPPPRTPPVPKRPVPPPIVSREATPAVRYRWILGAQGHVLGGFTPAPALGGGGTLGLESDGAGPLAPSFRLAPWVATTRAVFASNIGARLLWYGARLEICPVRPWLASRVRAEACAGVDAGLMHSSGFGVDHEDTKSSAWIAPMALGRLAWAVAGGFRTEFGVGAAVPVRRYSFDFESGRAKGSTELYSFPAVGALVTLGVVFELP